MGVFFAGRSGEGPVSRGLLQSVCDPVCTGAQGTHPRLGQADHVTAATENVLLLGQLGVQVQGEEWGAPAPASASCPSYSEECPPGSCAQAHCPLPSRTRAPGSSSRQWVSLGEQAVHGAFRKPTSGCGDASGLSQHPFLHLRPACKESLRLGVLSL